MGGREAALRIAEAYDEIENKSKSKSAIKLNN